MTASVQQVPLWVRAWHWITALLFLILTVTGAVMHFAAPGMVLAGYAAATSLHDIAGILLALVYGLYLTAMVVTGYWRVYVPSCRGLWRRPRDQLVFDVSNRTDGDVNASTVVAETRFSPVQRLVYLSVIVGLLPLLVVTGLLYFYPEHAPDRVLGLAGLWPVAVAHFALGALGAAYLIVHVYLGTLGPYAARRLRLMIKGREEPAEKSG